MLQRHFYTAGLAAYITLSRMNNLIIYAAGEEEVRSGLPLGRRLREFNYRHIGEYPESVAIWLNAKDTDGCVVGGLRGLVVLYWLRVELLWVEEPFRRHRLGSRLLAEAEEQARLLGAKSSGAETFDWQAPGFYEKQGYVEATRVGDYVGGHHLSFMRKVL